MQFANIEPVVFVTVNVVCEGCFLIDTSSKLMSVQPVLQERTFVVACGCSGPGGPQGLSEAKCKLVHQAPPHTSRPLESQ